MDYIAKDTALIATADAIREKTGTADPITWLEELGFSEAIAGIEAGGGSQHKFAYEIVTFSEDALTYTMTHPLGELPNICLFISNDVKQTFTSLAFCKTYLGGYGFHTYMDYSNSTSRKTGTVEAYTSNKDLSSSNLQTTEPDVGSVTETSLTFGASENYYFRSGATVLFVAGVIAE